MPTLMTRPVKTPFPVLLVLCMFMAMPVTVSFAADSGKVEGKAVYQEKPVAGVSVYAYKEPDRLFAKPAVVAPAVTDAEGRFALELPRGEYFIAGIKKAAGAEGIPGPGDFYCFYGGNPVTVDPARPVEIILNLVVKPPLKEDTETGDGHGGVEGIVTVNGEPIDGVRLYVYLDSVGSFRGMGYYNSPPTGANGEYRLRMGEGTYYIVARKRLSGMLAGPLSEGDYFGYPDINPVVVHKGKMRHIDIPMVRKAYKVSAGGGNSRTVLKGIIKGPQGRPASGVYACLYKGAEMVDRPAFVSRPTGQDGKFEVEVPVGGSYFLGARDTIGGPVEPGQLWGRYGGSADHSVVVETGKTLEGLEVTVEVIE